MDNHVRNILSAYAAASGAECEEGRAWYPSAQNFAGELCDLAPIKPHTAAGIIAALSPNCAWENNLRAARTLVELAADGVATSAAKAATIACGTFPASVEKAWAILCGAEPLHTLGTGLKTRSFYLNIRGAEQAVTIDRWASRIAGELRAVTPKRYHAMRSAYRRAAAETPETPRDLQAVTWVAAHNLGKGNQLVMEGLC